MGLSCVKLALAAHAMRARRQSNCIVLFVPEFGLGGEPYATDVKVGRNFTGQRIITKGSVRVGHGNA